MPENNGIPLTRRRFALGTVGSIVGLAGVASAREDDNSAPVKILKGTVASPVTDRAIETLRERFFEEYGPDSSRQTVAAEVEQDSKVVVGYLIGLKNGAPYELIKELPENISSDLAEKKTKEAHDRIDSIAQAFRAGKMAQDGQPSTTEVTISGDGGAVDWSKSFELEAEVHRDATVTAPDAGSSYPEWCGDIEADNYLLSVPDSNYANEWAVDFQVDFWPQVNEGDQQGDWDTEMEWNNYQSYITTRWDDSHFPLKDVVDMSPTRERKTSFNGSVSLSASNSVSGAVEVTPATPYIGVDTQNSRDEYVKTHLYYPYPLWKWLSNIGRYNQITFGQSSVATFGSGGSYDSYIVGCEVDHTFKAGDPNSAAPERGENILIGWDVRET